MNIIMIMGSPHRDGTSACLVDNFIEGALSKGHVIKKMETAFLDIHPCIGCEFCRSHNDQCVFKDDMGNWIDQILQADLLVFVTPLYYFGMSAQIKSVIDRFFAMNEKLQKMHKKTMMIATCADEEAWAKDALVLHYETLCRYMHFENKGILFADSVYDREDIEKTDYPSLAYALGLSIEKAA